VESVVDFLDIFFVVSDLVDFLDIFFVLSDLILLVLDLYLDICFEGILFSTIILDSISLFG